MNDQISSSVSDSGTVFEDVPVNTQARNAGVEKGTYEDSKIPFMTARTFFMCILVSMGGICFGYDTGQISGFLEMENFLYNFADQREPTLAFTWRRSGLIVGMLSIGTLFGALISAPIANHPRIGRRLSIFGWCIIFMVGNIIQIAARYPKWYEMMVGRIVSGLAIGGLSVVVPMYQGESAPAHIRGAIVCCYQLFITIGILLANLINFGTESISNTGSWRIPLCIGFAWALILCFGILLFPETPRFDFRQGNIDRARKNTARLHGVSENHRVVRDQMLDMEEKLAAEETTTGFLEVFKGKRMIYRILLGVGIQAFQQLSGANYFFYYGTTIFSSVGIENSFVTQIILGCVNVLCTFPGLYMVEKYGRRKCLTLGALWMCMCFLVFASLGNSKLYDAQGNADQTIGYVMIVVASLFIAAFASTWGPMAWACVAEMYPGKYRSQGIAFCSASNWFFNFCLAFFTPFITDEIDFAYGYVFAGCNLLAALLIYFFLIESNGKSLEEIDTMYLLDVPPRKSANWELPADVVAANALAREQGQRDRGLRERKHNLGNRESRNEVENTGSGGSGAFFVPVKS
ncbi:related to low-affinity hexose transporter HXT3 [Rhynchosporium secalis]|uniref:Related to low-affinity hexose transporter HXT3 n=1 Tax=Rhynchosporium secalis TaxID=38038 RepID=A0A1E1MHE7_RHYSE|nr:related to low-affinity hexose transporter HXT3 [Rhynchosporium secalis]